MIKERVMTPAVAGRISIGEVFERNGQQWAEQGDEFTITTQVQSHQDWQLHPLDAVMRQQALELAEMARGIEAIELQEIPAAFADYFKQPAQPPEPTTQQPAKPVTQPGMHGTCTPQAQVRETVQAEGLAAVLASTTAHPALLNAHSPVAFKLRSIPVRLLFNDPVLNLQVNYALLDRTTARPVCGGDGPSCQRVTEAGTQRLACSGPGLCPLAHAWGCTPVGRFHVRIDHPDNVADALSTFVLRTTAASTLRTLMARMVYLQAVSADLLAYLPLEIRLCAKPSRESGLPPSYYVDLGLRAHGSLEWAIQAATLAAEQAKSSGYDQHRLEQAARAQYALGLLDELEVQGLEIGQKFCPSSDAQAHKGNTPASR